MRNSVIKKNRKVYIFKHQQTESGGGGGADLEDNKTATIDVSAYTGPVTINPTAGKDGMKKTTVTLSNIPSPSGSSTAYAWNKGTGIEYYPFDIAPNTKTEYETSDVIYLDNNELHKDEGTTTSDYTKVSDTEFDVILQSGTSLKFTRDSTKDFTLW